MADIVRLQSGENVDQWTVVEKLGEGGFGSVYKVRKEKFDVQFDDIHILNNIYHFPSSFFLLLANSLILTHIILFEGIERR